MKKRRLTRREAITTGALAIAGLTLSGCGRKEAEIAAVADVRPKKEFIDVPPFPFTWEAIASGDKGPGSRSRHCLAFDQQGRCCVLFAGVVWSKPPIFKPDTWELSDGKWSEVATSDAPPPRHRGAMVYDSRQGSCVMFGGQGKRNEMYGDTWTYASRCWQQWTKWLGDRPSSRCGHSMAFDEVVGVTVLFGGIDPRDRQLGDTWIFDGARWESVGGAAPPARRYAAFAYDEELEGCLLHGGSVDDRGRKGFGDCWLFRDRIWSRMPSGFTTDVRDDQGMAYHRSAKRLVMLEGVHAARAVLVRDAEGWKKRETIPLHPRLQCSPLVWDEALDGLVMHGGEAGQGGRQFDTTWLLKRVEKVKG
jgi:hypothetical protein